jgi:hypothetical protein
MHHKRTLLSLVALAAVVLAGCANTTTQPASKVVDNSEYEYVTPVGSNIPVRVRKGQSAQTASPTATMSGESAQGTMHGAPGQAMIDKGGR